MKIGRIRLENFGPFFGTHEIDLTVSKTAPVVLIHGENERGKTSLANAIRWCLYKTALGRGGSVIPVHRLLNNDAKGSNQFNLSVSMEFEHDGARYKLERHAQADRPPTDDKNFEFRRALRKNGNFEPEGTVDRTVNDILHPQISRFFLFDGEMLNDYEELLRDPYRKTIVVKQSIEQILGLPSIQRGTAALAELRRNAERSQLQEQRSHRENEKLIGQAQQREEALNQLEKDIQRHGEIKAGLEQERDRLRSQMEQFGEVRADLRELDTCEKEIAKIDADSELCRESIQALLKEAWWLPLEQAIDRAGQDAQDRAAKASQNLGQREILDREIKGLGDTIHKAECTLCGHSLSERDVANLRKQLDDKRLAYDRLKPEGLEGYFETLTHLRPFLNKSNYQLLRERESALRKGAIRKRQLNAQIEQIRERVRTDYRAEIGHVERELEKVLRQLTEAERALTEAQAKRDETDDALQRLQAQIRKLPSANKKLAMQAGIFDALRKLFEMSVEEFRQQLRGEVERVASEIHKSLSAETGYVGLKINEQFGLSLVNDRGRTIVDRSAGSEQIVALSLIGALNRCATREGPVIMDTPFGRLDRRHRKNILKFAPNFGAQVVLLVQSGELERERDLGDLSEYLSREYRIERDGASDRSRITEIR